MTKVLVIGYYNHSNLGDEQYKISITYVLNQICRGSPLSVEYIDCDQIMEYDITPYSTVLLGGGDVLNTYFLNKLNNKFGKMEPGSQRPRIIAFSVGIPYNSIFTQPENLKKLEIFDYIFLRTLQDMQIFSQYFNKERLSYLPDTSCFLFDAIQPLYTNFNNKKMGSCSKKSKIVGMIDSDNNSYKALYTALQSLSRTKKIININLCRHIYNHNSPYKENYQNIIRELANFIENLIKQGYYIVLLPFNTKPTPEGGDNDLNHENDILIQADVLRLIKNPYSQPHPNILNINYSLTLPEILSLYQFFYISIPMRFHGTLFSIYAGVPMIPIYTTKKIKNILLDIDWKYEYVLDKNEKDLPISFNSNRMMLIFLGCVKYHTRCKLHLKTIYDKFKQYYNNEETLMHYQLFQSKPREPCVIIVSNRELSNTFTPEPPSCSKSQNYESNRMIVSPEQIEITNKNPDVLESVFQKLQNFAKEHGYDDFRKISDPNLQNVAVCITSYFLTEQIDSRYNDGMITKMFSKDYEFMKEWNWVLQDTKKNEQIKINSSILLDNPKGLFNIDYIDQNDQSGAHRSGWKYVFDNIKHLNSKDAPVLLDLYLDRTFHWKLDIYKHIGIVPYKKPWIGFIHHTFDTTFSEYNNEVLLNCPEFIESLRTCKGLIVLSNYLKIELESKLREINGIPITPIFVVKHPSEINVPQFSIDGFLKNPNKKLIHVGGWLRNIFSFYQLNISCNYRMDLNYPIINSINKDTISRCLCHIKRTFANKKIGENIIRELGAETRNIGVLKDVTIKKAALKGKYMNNYYPSSQFLQKLEKTLSKIENGTEDLLDSDLKFCSQNNTIKNNWDKHFYKYMENIFQSVEIIETLDNSSYDDLLSQNIIFLNLIDGSAINTLIECIIRNTPIIINKHPAVVELLGDDYPLYYSELNDVEKLLREPSRIKNAHIYLTKIDKSEYSIENFLNFILQLGKELQINYTDRK